MEFTQLTVGVAGRHSERFAKRLEAAKLRSAKGDGCVKTMRTVALSKERITAWERPMDKHIAAGPFV